MKKMKLLGMLALGLLTVNVAASSVQAEEVTGQGKESDTKVKIIDNTEPEDRVLVLKSVPSNYDFESTLQNGSYSLDATLTDQNIVVFNNQVNGEWSVKAAVEGNEIKKSGTAFPVTSFKVNDTEIAAPGSNGIVAQASAQDDTNVGDISTAVTKVSIGFNDSTNVLVPGDTLTGKINYKLFNTADAQ